MTLAELVNEFRLITQDQAKPYFFADKAIEQWLVDAEAEAAIRGRLLHESQNESICQIGVSPGTSVYALHPALYEITHIAIRHDGAAFREPLRLISEEELERTVNHWRDLAGKVRYAIQGDTTIRLVPSPDEAATLLLEGYRLPLSSVSSGSQKFEINPAHHRHLVFWALFRAFGIPDVETFDIGKAEDAERAFTGYFGARPDSDLRRITREDVSHSNKVFFP
ncbi:MAG: phage adaptor protein [Pseudomonadales bacterium]